MFPSTVIYAREPARVASRVRNSLHQIPSLTYLVKIATDAIYSSFRLDDIDNHMAQGGDDRKVKYNDDHDRSECDSTAANKVCYALVALAMQTIYVR